MQSKSDKPDKKFEPDKPKPEVIAAGERTEVAAQISLPMDGGWAWVVLIASFFCIAIMDGVVFTYGCILTDIAQELKITDAMSALINSITAALYFLCSPIASALINRYGFRTVGMVGSVITSTSLYISYQCKNVIYLYVFYGAFNGFGFSLINMAAGLIVGFYFERLRTIAYSISSCGSSVGIMLMSPLNTLVAKVADWRTVILFHSGLSGLIFFLAMTFKPLLSLTVQTLEDNSVDPTRTLTYLPNLAATGDASTKSEGITPKATERFFNAVSNVNFPTAANVVEEGGVFNKEQAGPSTKAASRLFVTANGPQGGISRQQLKQVKSLISRSNVQDKTKVNFEMNVPEVKSKKGCCGRFCRWEEDAPNARPMYRDDAFYDGRLEQLPAYQKSMMSTPDEAKTGLEYQLAVSRAVAVDDLQQRHGLCTTALRRVLATMIDPSILKERTFILLSLGGFLTYLGMLVPYVYLQDRNTVAGVDPKHCAYFLSTIGFSNAVGKFVLGLLATKIDPFILSGLAAVIAGVATIFSSLSYTLVFQYAYSFVFGFFTACANSLRSVLIVSLFGLEKLTNCTGMLLIFMGVANFISTPLAGYLKDNFGYDVAFYVSGAFIAVSGIVILLIIKVRAKDRKISVPAVVVRESSRKNITTETPKQREAK